MIWTAADIPDQTGKVAVVTGANGGLGLETARELARAGAHVVMAARNQDKAAEARDDITRSVPAASLEIVELDLASLESIRTAASTVLDSHGSLDLLVNNAGVMAVPEGRTVEDFEMQLGVNHLGHWALTSHLLDAVTATPHARIVSLTSTAHHIGRRIDPDNPQLHGTYGPWKAYGQSKLANLHFAIGLNDRLEAAGSTAISLCAHPGLTNSELQTRSVASASDGGDWLQRSSRWLAEHTGMSTECGALSQLRAATDPSTRGGELYGPLFVNNGPPVRKPILRRLGLDKSIDVLWAVSERETHRTINP